MKKRILALLLAVATASMLAGCGKDDGGQERESREESNYEQEESASEPEEPEEAPLLTSAFASAKPGNELQFGAYEQDNNLSDGAEPIEWVVLANEGDRILVLSKYVLVGTPEEIKNGEIQDDKRDDKWLDIAYNTLTWEVSSERKWLNSIFYQEAFTDDERSCILQSELTTPETYFTLPGNNFSTRAWGGEDTTDYLFSLSYEEFNEYVKPLEIEKAEARVASDVDADEGTGYANWLLRSPAVMRGADNSYLSLFASIHRESGDVHYTNETGRDDINSGRCDGGAIAAHGLRMAMWLKVE